MLSKNDKSECGSGQSLPRLPSTSPNAAPHLAPIQGASRRIGAYGGTFDIRGKTSTLHRRGDAACARSDALPGTVKVNHPSSWAPPEITDALSRRTETSADPSHRIQSLKAGVRSVGSAKQYPLPQKLEACTAEHLAFGVS
ncbi:hypothetical protein [Streptomyces sp. NPDC002215]|uniref:hypothetical protein n=1 Tax=Streptomyces sp. NPDC002215 TaxID=3154412 RepID=UPI0033289844